MHTPKLHKIKAEWYSERMISCTFENGGTGNLRHATVGTLIVKDHKLLLVKRSEFLSHGGKYCVPGGYVDRNETLAQAAKRETVEETGLDVTIERLFLFTDDPKRDDADKQNIVFFFCPRYFKKYQQHRRNRCCRTASFT